jgi:hypothetical protein
MSGVQAVLQVFKYLQAPSALQRQMFDDIPNELYNFWRAHAKEEFPNIPTSPPFFVASVLGIFAYFKCVEVAGDEQTLLPSNAADSIWHAWLELDEESVHSFCLRYYGRGIKHLPTEEFSTDGEEALARTYIISCLLDGQDFRSGYLPLLFRLDRTLAMPSGQLVRGIVPIGD